MEPQTSKRNRISDIQKNILERFYGAGMVGTGRLHKEKIEQAVVETGLAKAQVEKSIGNQKRNMKRSVGSLDTEQSTILKKQNVCEVQMPIMYL